MNRIFAILLTLFCQGCRDTASQSSEASAEGAADIPAESAGAAILAKAIETHGGNAYQQANIHFQFRGRDYEGSWNGGSYRFERRFTEDGIDYRDALTSERFIRLRGGELQSLPDSIATRYANSVNSVWYFALLPFRLQDPAVNAQDLGLVTIFDQTYHKVHVRFSEEGGGDDFEDEYVYWINTKDYYLDYLAYSFREKDGLGLRFRKAFNRRRIEGIIMQDYVNYQADPKTLALFDLDIAFEKDQLDSLSVIELESVKIFLPIQ